MLSILIVNWNTKDLLRACLASIERFPPQCSYQVIVVENASNDRSGDMVRTEFPDVELVVCERNTGYAHGNNLAFGRATGEWLLTLNPDTEVLESTLDSAISVLESEASYGALGAKQIGPDGNVQRSIRGFPRALGIIADALGLSRLFPNGMLGSYRLPSFDYEKQGPAPQPMGTFLMFRRRAIEAAGDAKAPMDEQFPIFFNEVDLLYRLNKVGWPALYSPSIVIKHHGGESTKQVRKSMIWESHKSLMRFFYKHHLRWWNAPGIWLLGAIVYAGAFVRARGHHGGFRA